MKKLLFVFIVITMLASCDYNDTVNIEKKYPKSEIIPVPYHESSEYIVKDTIRNSLRYIRTGSFSNNIIMDVEICEIKK